MQIVGGFDVGYQQLNIRGAKVTQSAASNGSYTSNVIFKGTEDLGGGLKANFQYEIDPGLTETASKTAGTTATGTTSNITSSAGNGQSFLELAGGFGSIKLGTPNSSTLSANGDGNAGFGTAIGSGYRVTSFDAVRFQNTLRYDTPSFSGFSAGYLMGAKNDKQANAGTAGFTGNVQNQAQGRDQVSELSAVYANGPLTVRYADLRTKQYAGVDVTTGTIAAAGNLLQPTWTAGTGAEFKLKTISAKYDVNQSLTVAYFNQKTDSEVLKATKTTSNTTGTAQFARKASGLAAAYTMGATKFMLNRAQVTIGDETNLGTVDNTKTTVTGLGVDYAMSKRTTAYVRYEKDDDKAKVRAITGYTASPTTNTDYTATAIGIRHTF